MSAEIDRATPVAVGNHRHEIGISRLIVNTGVNLILGLILSSPYAHL